ncbi:MAG: hypothetical protein Q4G43_04890 [Mobilicoccus sp.]|nr:hypothetical protein [Mobilicoccus sp.]
MSTSPLLRRLSQCAAACALAGAGLIGIGQAASAADGSCETYVQAVTAPGEWQIACADDVSEWPETLRGYADPRGRQIMVRAEQGDADLLHTIGHELWHAYDFEYLTAEGRQVLLEALGQASWIGEDYWSSPAEVFADNGSRCAGWHDGGGGFTEVGCEVIRDSVIRSWETTPGRHVVQDAIDDQAAVEAPDELQEYSDTVDTERGDES